MRRVLFPAILALVAFTSTAQVGIGTKTPVMQLHVSSADSAVAILENRQLLNAGIGTALYFKTGTTGVPYNGAIKTIGTSTGQARLGLFTFSSSNANNLKERLSITDDGYVGVGVTAPLSQLHVASPTEYIAMLENTQSLAADVSDALYFKTGSTGVAYTGAVKTIGEGFAYARLAFFTYASSEATGLKERMSIADNGNVGIGITSANASLSVARGVSNDGTAAFFGTNNVSHFNYSTEENTYIRGGKPSSKVYINDASNGDVSIGNGAGKVSVNGSVVMNIRHGDFFSSSYVYVYDNDYTLVVDFSNSPYLGRQIILPYATGRTGVIYNICAFNIPLAFIHSCQYCGRYCRRKYYMAPSKQHTKRISSKRRNKLVCHQ